MPKRTIVVIGSSNTDMIIQTPRIPGPGETVLGGTFSMAAGGKGANQAVAAARAGGSVALIARIGEDLFGEQALRGFVADGINVTGLTRDPEAPSGIALIFVDASGENSIGVAAGANTCLSPGHVAACAPMIRAAGIVVVQLEVPLESVGEAAVLARAAGVPLILNPAPAAPVPPEILAQVSILTPNEHEARVLTGIEVYDTESAARAANELRRLGIQTVIITMGARGAYLASSGWEGMMRGFAVKAVDSTGAGDVFNGALAVALTEGKSMREAVTFAGAAAAISVTRLGAQPSIPRRPEIDAFLAAREPLDMVQ